MANPEHVRRVREQGAAAIAWLEEHQEIERLNLSAADLRGAVLSQVNLAYADLTEANLSDAYLFGANFDFANLTKANLSLALLDYANLEYAHLNGANLTLVQLEGANFRQVDLAGANLAEAECWGTVFADCNLYQAHGLESVIHKGPSSIGIDTLMKSFRAAGNRLTPELETFFRGAGVPKQLLAELPRILAEVRYCTCFIGYGEPDKDFAETLYNDLEARGVSCWLYSMDATPGERTWREIVERRREAQKMVVLCSASALVRDGVLKEIEEQIDEDPEKMVPVSLDELWKEPGFPVMRGSRDLKPFLKERNYADFTKPYGEALERLLKGLERRQS